MRDEAETSVLRRMAGLRAAATSLAAMTAEKALRNAMAKAGDDMLGTAVGVRDVVVDTRLPDAVMQGLPEPALFMRLNGPGGAVGLAVACPQVVAAVIEAQTIGHVLGVAAADRRPTRTDAVLVGGFLGPALSGFAALAIGCANPPPVNGYGCGAALVDARAAQMVLDDAAHRCFSIELDFGNGAKTGKLVLVYPSEHAAGPMAGKRAEDWQATLENAVLGAAARMEAVLCRLKLPLADVAGLAVGDCLTLTGATLDGLSLVGSDGSTVIKARLGRSGPSRAVRLYLKGAPPRRPAPMTDAAPLPLAAAPNLGGVAPDLGSAAGDMGVMDAAAMATAANEPMAMEPMAADLDAMNAATMELDPQPLEMPALVEPQKIT